MPHVIFYSWQSDLPNSTNRGFIQNALEQAVKSLANEGDPTIEPVLDRDTAGVAGSPDIGQTIFAKISKAAALVCDVSIINSGSPDDRPTPNPNVLIELGFGLNALGPGKLIMVMNTEYGGPENLPFDLKQKLVMTYRISQNDTDKAAARKGLGQSLAAAIKAILIEAQRESEARTAAETPSLSAQATAAVKAGRPDQGRAIGNFMKWLAAELKNLDPHKQPGDADENLIQAIDKTVPLVREFATVADAVSAMNSEETARMLYKNFEHIVSLCYLPKSFSGGAYNLSDFDLFKFIAHELLITFAAYLIRDERWSTLGVILNQPWHINKALGDQLVPFQHLCETVILLDEIRIRRLDPTLPRPISVHADLLKKRHDNGPLSGDLTWEEFVEADLILFLRGHSDSNQRSALPWWPRTAVYLGLQSSSIPDRSDYGNRSDTFERCSSTKKYY